MSALDDLISGAGPQTPSLDALLTAPKANFINNLTSNAGKVLDATGEAIADPVGTAKTLGKLGIGMAEEFVPGQQQYETQYADPFYRKIGGDVGFAHTPSGGITWDSSKLAKNAYERPVDLALDAASAIAPLESLPGRAGEIASLINPLNIAGKGVSIMAKTATKPLKYMAGEASGMGPNAVSQAYSSGAVGGVEGQAFRAGMRGDLNPQEPVDLARGVVSDLKKERGQAYTQDMTAAGIKGNPNPQSLQFQPIEDAFNNVSGVKSFRGKSLKPSVDAARDQVRAALDEWKADPGSWTAEGFDALKQRVQDIGQSLNPATEGAARTMVGNVASAIKGEIVKQAPEYAKIMSAYESASNAIDELTRTFSLGNKSTYDTALRKLQSVLRNNAFTNYTGRAKLAELIQSRAPELMPMLSGQAASAIMPRGLPAKMLAGGAGIAGVMGGLAANPLTLVPMLGAAAASSPRILGEIAHGAGRVVGGIRRGVSAVPAPLRKITKTTAPSLAGYLSQQ